MRCPRFYKGCLRLRVERVGLYFRRGDKGGPSKRVRKRSIPTPATPLERPVEASSDVKSWWSEKEEIRLGWKGEKEGKEKMWLKRPLAI